MEKSAKVSAKEAMFCGFYLRLGDAAEAARQAGYPAKNAEQAAVRLLTRPTVREELERQCEQMRGQVEAEALAGLRRLALGSRNDAAYLATAVDVSLRELNALDLFGVAEIKQAKDGGCDIKFIDRLPALTLLLDYGRASRASQPGSLLDALEQSARALTAGGGQSEV